MYALITYTDTNNRLTYYIISDYLQVSTERLSVADAIKQVFAYGCNKHISLSSDAVTILGSFEKAVEYYISRIGHECSILAFFSTYEELTTQIPEHFI